MFTTLTGPTGRPGWNKNSAGDRAVREAELLYGDHRGLKSALHAGEDAEPSVPRLTLIGSRRHERGENVIEAYDAYEVFIVICDRHVTKMVLKHVFQSSRAVLVIVTARDFIVHAGRNEGGCRIVPEALRVPVGVWTLHHAEDGAVLNDRPCSSVHGAHVLSRAAEGIVRSKRLFVSRDDAPQGAA